MINVSGRVMCADYSSDLSDTTRDLRSRCGIFEMKKAVKALQALNTRELCKGSIANHIFNGNGRVCVRPTIRDVAKRAGVAPSTALI
ncbi:MAG TPA: hypothetical protein VK101_11320, partial [Limnochordia bacterium]|nr:hypothetical protein [Limnochordia bacterium]